MATAGQARGHKVPVHLWIVAALSLIWSAFGCFDFLMTNVRDPGYLAQFLPDMVDYIDAFPGWMVIAWAMGVGFALLGSLLLLARSRWTPQVFALSLLGLAATQGYQFAVTLPPGMNMPLNWAMTATIWIIAVTLLLYAIRMRARGVLR